MHVSENSVDVYIAWGPAEKCIKGGIRCRRSKTPGNSSSRRRYEASHKGRIEVCDRNDMKAMQEEISRNMA